MMDHSVMKFLIFIRGSLYQRVLNTITTIITKPWAKSQANPWWIIKTLWAKVPTKIKQKVTRGINQSTKCGRKGKLEIQEQTPCACWMASLLVGKCSILKVGVRAVALPLLGPGSENVSSAWPVKHAQRLHPTFAWISFAEYTKQHREASTPAVL